LVSTEGRAQIRLRGVVKDFALGRQRVRALAFVDLDVATGEFLLVMGPSGSGKSTLLNLIGGLDRPTQGRILVDGRDLGHLDEIALAAYRRQMIGFVFQSFNLIPSMTAAQNVAFPMLFAGRSAGERRLRAESLLRQLGLIERSQHRPVELSGGEQQRVAIARAVANAPRIILGDEPTGNLDSHTGQDIMEVLASLNRSGRTVIVVSHDVRLTDYAHRVVHMEDGRIVDEVSGGSEAPRTAAASSA
jgi:putative ABC transport system ATP-binding protein